MCVSLQHMWVVTPGAASQGLPTRALLGMLSVGTSPHPLPSLTVQQVGSLHRSWHRKCTRCCHWQKDSAARAVIGSMSCACIEAMCLCACAGANAGGMLGSCALVSVLCEPFVHTKAGGTCMCAASRRSVAVMSHLCQHVLHAPLQGMSRIPPCLRPLGLSCCITYPSAVQKGLFPVACRVLSQVPHGWPHYR